MVLSMITNMTDDDSLFVDMETNKCGCNEEEPLFDTMNGWEYYFVQQPFNPLKETTVLNMQQTGNINFSYIDINVGMDLERYVAWKNRFYNNFKLKPSVSDFVDEYYVKNISGKITLGVQIRQTDQKYYHNMKGIEAYISRITQILAENPYIEQIFLATEDSLVIPVLENAISLPVIYHKEFYRANEIHRHNNPYDRFNDKRKLHRYLLSLECLQDIFTLTKCDYLLKAEMSSISIVACLLSENIKKVYRI